MLHRKRLELAFEQIQSSEWARFEQFASAFLTSDFPNIRTMATPSGDEGRDAELFSPQGDTGTMLQYSVTEQWNQKIKDTVKKIKKNFPHVTDLVYVTNKVIGAKGDPIRREVRKDQNIVLDIYDRNYFLDRFEGDTHRETVAANFAKDIVDPYLERKQIIQKSDVGLSIGESRAALVFLELQWEDDTREKGLTKLAFDGLVRLALRDTNLDARIGRSEVQELVAGMLPARERDFVVSETNKSLTRLAKKFIRHHNTRGEDSFCLTNDESQRIKDRLAQNELENIRLDSEIEHTLRSTLPDTEFADPNRLRDLLKVCRSAIEKYMLQRGELFVSAIQSSQVDRLSFDSLHTIVDIEIRHHFSTTPIPEKLVQRVAVASERILTSSTDAVEAHLRSLADSYTMMAFLKETPDVQNAVRKMFSEGEIWLDTSVILPLFSEDLLLESEGQFRRLLNAAHNAGIKLKVTPGVVEEVERHMNRSLACSIQTGLNTWQGSYPYLYSYYIATGASPSGFQSWLEKFRGTYRPEDDVSDYIKQFFHIATQDIVSDLDKSDPDLRNFVKEEWLKIHKERRRHGDSDPLLALRLAEHDTENFIGVIVRRHQQEVSAFGYTSWWLTLDQMAFTITARLKSAGAIKAPPSPVMSADFLSNYLAFGPLRDKVSKATPEGLPVALDPALVQYISPELIAIAKKVRSESEGLEEYIIRRNVRDAMDNARRRVGAVTQNGLQMTVDATDLG